MQMGLTTSQLSLIPDGPAGTLETLKIMSRLVRTGKTALPVRQTAVALTNGLAQKDWLREAAILHAFVRDKIRYVKDIKGVETLHTPDKILEFGAGDCDDKSVLLASLLESLGHPTRFVAIGFQRDNYAHVYVETKIGPRWIACETTEPVSLGWEPRGYVSRLEIHN